MIGKTHFFEITGSGMFPHRLLAEQRCFPEEESDAIKAFERSGFNRTIKLKSIVAPNPDLWRSYGWMVRLTSNNIPPEDYTNYHTWPC